MLKGALAVLLAASAVSGPATDRTADRAAIIAGEKAWGQAFVKGDLAAVRRLLADDFHGIAADGTAYGKAQTIAEIRAGPRITSDRVQPIAVYFYGDTAIIQAHEHVNGPLPEAHPSDGVFTDTWIKRGGQWQIVAAHDMKLGLPTLPQFQVDVASIKAARARNNKAIAAHDIASFLPMFADDAVFTWSNGSHAIGKQDLRIFFVEDFSNPNFDRYVRAPASVSVSDRGNRAIERGSWTALKKDTRYGGDYIAHWMKKEQGWRVVGELYVKLYCSGPLCTP
jgi:ketosteroid isomerase-like protein